MLALASPDYLDRHGEPTMELHRHRCINWRFPGSGSLYQWEFDRRGKKIELSVEGPLIANLQEIAHEGALQGLGILYAHDCTRLGELIPRGRLKRVLTEWTASVPGLFLYFAGRRYPQPALHRLPAGS